MQIDIKKSMIDHAEKEEEKLYSIALEEVDKQVFSNILPGFEVVMDQEKLTN